MGPAPRATFFAQVFDYGADPPDEPAVWIGVSYAEVVYADTLARRLSPWADLPAEVAEWLEDDRRVDAPWPRGLDIQTWGAMLPPAPEWKRDTSPGPDTGANW